MKSLSRTVSMALILAAAQAHAESPWTASTGVDYSSGKYGATGRTETLYVPISVKYEHADWSLRGTVPYVEMTGPADVVGQGTDRILLATNGTTRRKATGLGDVVLAANWTAFQQNKWLLEIGTKVKLATADVNAGLGTGKNDYSLQSEIYHSIDQHTLFATLGYKKIGVPDGTQLKDPFYLSLGWSLRQNSQTSFGLNYDYRQKIQDAGAPIREASAFVTHKLDADWKLQTYLLTGFSKASPEFGAGMFAFYAF